MEEEFDYGKAMAELERIAVKVEDPSTGLDETEVLIKRSDELVRACRAYLRKVRETTESL